MDGKERSIRNQFTLEQRRNRNKRKAEGFRFSQSRIFVIREIAQFLLNMFAPVPKPFKRIRGSQQSRWDPKNFAQQASARRRAHVQYDYLDK